MMTSYHLSNQQKIVDFFKKSVEERSNGRVSLTMQATPRQTADQLAAKLADSQNSLAIIETRQLNQQASPLKILNKTENDMLRTEFYRLIDSTLGCKLYIELASQNFELLAIWDNGLQCSAPLSEQSGSQKTVKRYNTYALIMEQKQWGRLPADIKIIIHEALYVATLYAFELAEYSDSVKFSSNQYPHKNHDGIMNLRQGTFAEFYKTCHGDQTADQLTNN